MSQTNVRDPYYEHIVNHPKVRDSIRKLGMAPLISIPNIMENPLTYKIKVWLNKINWFGHSTDGLGDWSLALSRIGILATIGLLVFSISQLINKRKKIELPDDKQDLLWAIQNKKSISHREKGINFEKLLENQVLSKENPLFPFVGKDRSDFNQCERNFLALFEKFQVIKYLICEANANNYLEQLKEMVERLEQTQIKIDTIQNEELKSLKRTLTTNVQNLLADFDKLKTEFTPKTPSSSEEEEESEEEEDNEEEEEEEEETINKDGEEESDTEEDENQEEYEDDEDDNEEDEKEVAEFFRQQGIEIRYRDKEVENGDDSSQSEEEQ
eukprot:TRINITY_DN4922_c0_g1_i2.p1 TRINITY_DN4922_c0_g1~~TRINITY_DN4922_c0_g1_i2.p1  ORF type:complete len:327 (+),score=125.03 TRINITY_DN4922_c0_g1_i2:139-1119(+)